MYNLLDVGMSEASIQTKPMMKGLTGMLERLEVPNKGVSPKMTTMTTSSRIGFRFDEDWLLDVGVLMATAARLLPVPMVFDHGLHAHASIRHLLDMVLRWGISTGQVSARDWNGTEWKFDAKWVSDLDSVADIKTEELGFKDDMGRMAMVQTHISVGREQGLHKANDMAGCFDYIRSFDNDGQNIGFLDDLIFPLIFLMADNICETLSLGHCQFDELDSSSTYSVKYRWIEDQSFRVDAQGRRVCGKLRHVWGGKHMLGGGRMDILWLQDGQRQQGPAIWLRSVLVWSDMVLDKIDFSKVMQQGQAECRKVDSQAYNAITAFSNDIKWLGRILATHPLHLHEPQAAPKLAWMLPGLLSSQLFRRSHPQSQMFCEWITSFTFILDKIQSNETRKVNI
ncbi:hypothetical protein ARMGADRAFT_1029261 [Armillaria gallica]|uniref:Uncharacterized protein n=1 Tax=Armillaria gallica TaxID=47427 RepID=A0A2H3DVR3_ARMGA|nr:hypothetical protein ARMGADRAFT_1029261 [Armillaria gallica]